eukprot:CAMPEP_0185760366 /NCGR_PEP_ID=MMETSP1174-20130828/19227_1 /TAXON_ID=35687 /ORGANISM="Dictyocha speculum, Strain CCMP1381" /LENGTH=167 /DNA_ID=CAMNT_0028441135 /DNA_START=116 /DNA_END=615 /DNA_ORIENTATION=+
MDSLLQVDFVGFGHQDSATLGHAESPNIFFILSIQQQNNSWLVYRNVPAFQALSVELAPMVANLTPFPTVPPPQQLTAQLDPVRDSLQQWMLQILMIPSVPQTAVVRNFLVEQANLPPPRLTVVWYKGGNKASFDEMDMDDLYGDVGEDQLPEMRVAPPPVPSAGES